MNKKAETIIYDTYILQSYFILELFKKYVRKRKLRVNLLKTKITFLQGAKGSLGVGEEPPKASSDIIAQSNKKLLCTSLKFLHSSDEVPPCPYMCSPK
jgi:hypothetical protein